ncbi:MAG: hypothetical protein ABF370_20635, partial [Verrucomicrobiales bacterium]
QGGSNPIQFLGQSDRDADRELWPEYAESQTQWDLLRVVCALQRYRLKHAGFSEDLDTLVTGEFMKNLPHGYVPGKPPAYGRREQSFTLASLDWDGSGLVDDLVGHVVGDSY